MKVAFVRHPEMGGDIDAQVKKSTESLRAAGFVTGVTIYHSPSLKTKIVAGMISREMGYPAPIASPAIGLDDGEKSGATLKVLCEKKGVSEALGHKTGGMLVLVTHEPVIRAMTGERYVDYAQVLVRDLP